MKKHYFFAIQAPIWLINKITTREVFRSSKTSTLPNVLSILLNYAIANLSDMAVLNKVVQITPHNFKLKSNIHLISLRQQSLKSLQNGVTVHLVVCQL